MMATPPDRNGPDKRPGDPQPPPRPEDVPPRPGEPREDPFAPLPGAPQPPTPEPTEPPLWDSSASGSEGRELPRADPAIFMKDGPMRIAQVSPLYESVPPKAY